MSNLYTIESIYSEGGKFNASIFIESRHPIFSGHFPGKPVVPGVVLVEIAAAVASRVAGVELRVKEAATMKFLNMIDPVVMPVFRVEFSIDRQDGDVFKAAFRFYGEDTDFAKFRGVVLAAG